MFMYEETKEISVLEIFVFICRRIFNMTSRKLSISLSLIGDNKFHASVSVWTIFPMQFYYHLDTDHTELMTDSLFLDIFDKWCCVVPEAASKIPRVKKINCCFHTKRL